MAGNTLAARVAERAKPVAEGMGLALWDVLYVKEGASWYLRVIIDKEGGVNIDDCEALSRALDDIVDAESEGAGEFIFEVSSPGLGRELRRDEHLAAWLGKPVRVRLYKALDGTKELFGELESYDSQSVTIAGQQPLARADVAHIFADDDRDLF